jgi:hypothetical protein
MSSMLSYRLEIGTPSTRCPAGGSDTCTALLNSGAARAIS